MKSFLMSLALLALVTVGASIILNVASDGSSKSVYTDKPNVRL
jgi:hypothetical protein